MKHKKQYFDLLERTIKWNNKRGNTSDTLDWNLEIAMLQEELNELKEAQTDVDRWDALLDLQFVLTGSEMKMGLLSHEIVEGYEIVVSANESKGSKKDKNGKIIKDKSNFIEPEPLLQEILNNRKSK